MMVMFLLPKIQHNMYKNIQINTQDLEQDTYCFPVISNSLSFYLNDIKKQIYEYEYDWDIFKKYTNPFEFIHTNIPNKKYCISKYKPISRAYFKMVELIHTFNLGIDSPHPIRTFHLAEGPGGFIEAVAKLRMSSKDSYIGMTLLDSKHDPNIPGWKKTESFLREFKNVQIENGIDGTGNILSFKNFVYIHSTYGSSMDLITADGGFDFSDDFENQELNMVPLLYGQIIYALCMQKQGGSFVLKIFDIFLQQTIDMMALLSSMYQQVYITKPNSSRYANSEKYIVCKGFIPSSSIEFFPYLYNSFQALFIEPNIPFTTITPSLCKTNTNININVKSILKQGFISSIFINKLEEYNIIFGQQQIENIHTTLLLIITYNEGDKNNDSNEEQYVSSINNRHKHFCDYRDDKVVSFQQNPYNNACIRKIIKINIQKCIQWCIKHKNGYNYDL